MPMPSQFLDLNLVIALGAIIPSIILGTLVYFRGQKEATNKIFVLASLSIVLWAVANYFSLYPTPNILFWARLVMLGAVLLVFTFFLFIYTFLGPDPGLSTTRLWGFVVLAGITMIATQTPFVFRAVQFENGQAIPITGPLIPLFAFTVLLFFILGGRELVKKIRISSGEQKMQLLYVAIGYFGMFILLITTQFVFAAIFRNTYFIKFGPLFTLPFLVMTAYAILKHHLFNVKVISTEIFSAVLITLLLFQVGLAPTPIRFLLNIAVLAGGILFSFFLIRGVIWEIAERERSERMARELQAANEELKKLDKAKSAFISLASHQLRTPLAAIKGYLSMALEGSFGDLGTDRLRTALEKVYASNERLIDLIDDFLNVSRIEAGRMPYNFQTTNLTPLVKECVEEMKPAAEGKNILLTFHEPDAKTRFSVKLDEEKIRQSFLNIIDNAIKYTARGEIVVSISADGTSALVRIQDTGIGMNPEELENIFKPFTRGSRSIELDTHGSGLGLYIASQFVKAHGGDVWARSEGSGKGSAFFIRLPLVA